MSLAKFGEKAAAALAVLWYRLDRRHRETVRRNLTFAYGEELSPEERERLAREVFVHFVRFGWEMLVLLVAPLAYVKKQVVVLGAENHTEALKKGRGAVALVAHAGNWEYTGLGYALHCRPLAVVARELDHPLGRQLARYLRERCGNWMVDKRGGLKHILAHLRQNRLVGIVVDQNTAEREGVLVDFFGKPARTTPVAALLARRGVPVLPSLSRRLSDGRHLIVLFPELPFEKTGDVEADIQRHLTLQNQIIEAWVRQEPAQWLWLHRRWKNRFPELYRDL
ncbi:MAG: lysophospholipid acyltransferase family protein [Desulfobaccales bacterium]